MDTLIVGCGEIGVSLLNILEDHYDCDTIDSNEVTDMKPDIMHICFPYSDNFVEYVKEYQKKYKPKFTVIHSTVPIGTSRKCNAIHSPVEGIHPHLEDSMKIFTKYLSGENADQVADYFRRAGIKVYIVDKQESTELMKIMSTTFYGMQIEFTKEMKTLCDKYKVPFELFTLWNMNYNESYEELGYPEYKKPLLVPIMNTIKGHCVLPNTSLLDNDFTNFLKKRNGKR